VGSKEPLLLVVCRGRHSPRFRRVASDSRVVCRRRCRGRGCPSSASWARSHDHGPLSL
jgi:hypothetical protein